MSNFLKTALMMSAITALFIIIGWMIDGSRGMTIALLFAFGMNFFSYWFSDKIVLHMYNVREVDENTAPRFYENVKELASCAKLPMPRIYLINEDSPNAFATGRNASHASIAATTGILQILSDREMRGVIAHELAHVKHNDILISTITATIAGAISILTNFFVIPANQDERQDRSLNPILAIIVMLFSPIAGALIQMAISRVREFEADRGGSKISGDPRALASALDKIHRYATSIPFYSAEQYPATAQMMIMNPLRSNNFLSLFSTHPSTEERIARLIEMANKVNFK
ncbi:MAG: zinc metalloprotease HtpX [Burkholderia sp.]|nr:zinc metalloprotease HtpX [Burkholderia sp.]